MLVLTRSLNEKVVIDGNIVVTIVDIRGGKIRLGFEAPKDVKIWRGEVFDERSKNHRESSTVKSEPV